MIGILVVATLVLAVCLPAAKFTARIVEKKPHTLSVGGASFVGIIVTPLLVCLANFTFGKWLDYHIPVMILLAAGAIAYAFGEGVGRLACISFGCCYGKPLSKCSSILQKLFAGRCFVFTGKTKKIAYSSNLDGLKVIPIQAITAILFVSVGFIGIFFFLTGYYGTAFILTLTVTQLWRTISEMFRADFRGKMKFSAYQAMALTAVFYSVGMVYLFPVTNVYTVDILAGIQSLWHPGIILFLQSLWVLTFIYTGRSRVTEAVISFRVLRDCI